MNARLQIVRESLRSAIVAPWGFDMDCSFDYEPEEAACYDDRSPCPGSPANAALVCCIVGGVDIVDMLTLGQREHIEEKILEQLEG